MRTAIIGISLCVALMGAASLPKKVTIELPPSAIQFKPGPNLNVVQANCLVCHNADYVYNQAAMTRPQWTAEVNKMRGAYKANIADDAVPKIVDYLMSQNGKT